MNNEKIMEHSDHSVMTEAWFSYIVIHRRCPSAGLIAGGRRWIKFFVFLKSFSPSVISLTDRR